MSAMSFAGFFTAPFGRGTLARSGRSWSGNSQGFPRENGMSSLKSGMGGVLSRGRADSVVSISERTTTGPCCPGNDVTMPLISDKQLEQFKDDGFFITEPMWSPRELDAVAA